LPAASGTPGPANTGPSGLLARPAVGHRIQDEIDDGIPRLALRLAPPLGQHRHSVVRNASCGQQPPENCAPLGREWRYRQHSVGNALEDLAPEAKAATRQLERIDKATHDHRIARNAEAFAVEGMLRCRLDVPVGVDATLQWQERLELSLLVLGQISKGIRQLEVDGRQADHAGTRDVSDLHPCRLEREDAGLRSERVSPEVYEDVDLVRSNAFGRFLFGKVGDDFEM